MRHRARTAGEDLADTPTRPRPAPAAPNALLALQSSVGNSAVGRLLSLQRGRTAATAASAGQAAPAAMAAETEIPGSARRAKVIKQPAYASGDQFAIAAALLANRSWHVFVVYDGEQETPGRKIRDFYLESGIGPDKVHLVGKSQFKTVRAALPGFTDVSNGERDRRTLGVGQVTAHVGQTFDKKMRYKARMGWGLDANARAAHDKDAMVEGWLAGKGVALGGSSKIAVLWSRFSGKNREVHIEHDTSYVGMSQIIASLGSLDYVLIVGDAAPREKPRERRHDKYAAIAAHYNRQREADQSFSAQVVDLTEFWQESAVKEWGGARTGQFLLFDRLNRLAAPARHVGFRSGNLEAMALMGFQVRYLEEPESIGGERMEAWHDAKTGGKGIGYERIIVGAPPTRSGKHQVDSFSKDQRATGDQKHAEWHDEDDAHERKMLVKSTGAAERSGKDEKEEKGGSAADLRSRPKGFSDRDLEKIDNWLLGG